MPTKKKELHLDRSSRKSPNTLIQKEIFGPKFTSEEFEFSCLKLFPKNNFNIMEFQYFQNVNRLELLIFPARYFLYVNTYRISIFQSLTHQNVDKSSELKNMATFVFLLFLASLTSISANIIGNFWLVN